MKLGIENYQNIYAAINDTVDIWSNNKIQFYYGKKNINWEIDSLITINNTLNKLITVIHKRCFEKNCKMDDIQYLYGVKISNLWYFFGGPTVVITRVDGRGYSFKKLHEIAMEEVFSGYLIKNKKTGEWEINEAFFASIPNKNTCVGCTGYGPCFECKTENEYYMYVVNDNWKHKDTTNYERLREEEMKKK